VCVTAPSYSVRGLRVLITRRARDAKQRAKCDKNDLLRYRVFFSRSYSFHTTHARARRLYDLFKRRV